MKLKITAAIAATLMATGVQAAPLPALTAEMTHDEMVEGAKGLIRKKLLDPESARFSDTFIAESNNLAVVCGKVNAKNTYGGYAGHVYYYVKFNPTARMSFAGRLLPPRPHPQARYDHLENFKVLFAEWVAACKGDKEIKIGD